jgi:hypothetical protein
MNSLSGIDYQLFDETSPLAGTGFGDVEATGGQFIDQETLGFHTVFDALRSRVRAVKRRSMDGIESTDSLDVSGAKPRGNGLLVIGHTSASNPMRVDSGGSGND